MLSRNGFNENTRIQWKEQTSTLKKKSINLIFAF